jgi:hypothetical protein
MKKYSLVSVVVVVGLVGLLLTAGSLCLAHGANGNPGVLPVNSKPYGKTYGEWSAEHWKWLLSMPYEGHPLNDDGDVDLSKGQSGHVWFLGGTFTSTELPGGIVVGEATRNGTVPVGKALFFPIIDTEASTLEGNGTTYEELLAVAAFFTDAATNLSCEVDGVAVQNLEAYRVQSPLDTFGPLPDGNLLGAPEGATSPFASDGYFLMLAPLSAGQHTIHFTGEIDLLEEFGFVFMLDITYNLTVAP